MKPNRVYLDYLQDALDAITKANDFTEGMSYTDFQIDDKTIFAVIRALEVIGEATKKIPPSAKEKYPEMPWREIAGMRDKLTHDYFGVNLAIVWATL